VRDAAKRARVVEEVNEAARALGLEVVNVIESPIQGAEGNVEYLAFYKFDLTQRRKDAKKDAKTD